MDGIMEQLVGAPRTEEDWILNNPKRAALEFVEKNTDFVIDEPPFLFNEGKVSMKSWNRQSKPDRGIKSPTKYPHTVLICLAV
jgi:hypothetical protein